MALLTSGRLRPQSLIELLLESSSEDLGFGVFSAMLLIVRVPREHEQVFVETVERFALRGTGPRSIPSPVVTTSEVPTAAFGHDEFLEPDHIGLLSELESSTHVVVPLPSGFLGVESVVLGRSRDSDLVLLDPSVSHTHAEIECSERGFAIIDLNSKNGTVVNGTRLAPGSPHWLQPMDRLEMGRLVAFTCAPRVLRTMLRQDFRNLT